MVKEEGEEDGLEVTTTRATRGNLGMIGQVLTVSLEAIVQCQRCSARSTACGAAGLKMVQLTIFFRDDRGGAKNSRLEVHVPCEEESYRYAQ